MKMLKLLGHLNQNLPQDLFFEMKRIVKKCSSMPEAYLFSACEKHGRDAQEEAKKNSEFNLEAAEKLAASFAKLKDHFSGLSEEAQIGLKAAMYYFALNEDGTPDFATSDGLDDDILVANICFDFAVRPELKI